MTEVINRLARAGQSRINGAKSKGPTTPEGKAISRGNAIKHGFAAAQNVLLSIEDEPDFQIHLAGLRDSYAPRNYQENTFVEQLANISWRQARIASIEPALIDVQMALQNDRLCETHPDAADDNYFHLAEAWRALARPAQKADLKVQSDAIDFDINSLALLLRYQTSLDRQYRNVLSNLRQYRKDFAPALTDAPAVTAITPNEPAAPPPPTPETTPSNDPKIKTMPSNPPPTAKPDSQPKSPGAVRPVTPIDKR